jgi:hypothetical protein
MAPINLKLSFLGDQDAPESLHHETWTDRCLPMGQQKLRDMAMIIKTFLLQPKVPNITLIADELVGLNSGGDGFFAYLNALSLVCWEVAAQSPPDHSNHRVLAQAMSLVVQYDQFMEAATSVKMRVCCRLSLSSI